MTPFQIILLASWILCGAIDLAIIFQHDKNMKSQFGVVLLPFVLTILYGIGKLLQT